VEYRILGPLQVLDGATPVTLGTAKEQALLAVLLLHANEVVSNERLIDELWGEAPPPTARKAVQVYVSQLRKALAVNGSAIETRSAGYVLEVDPECVDATRFAHLVAEARKLQAEGEIEAAARLFRLGDALWRGHALAGLHLRSYAASQVESLEDLRVSTLMDRVDCDLALGYHADVVGELEELAAQHPFHERLVSQRMVALYRSGRQADALRIYRDARATLVDELGIEPSVGLQRLEREILTHDPALEPLATIVASDGDSGGEAGDPRQARAHDSRFWRRRRPLVLIAVALLVGFMGATLLLTRAARSSSRPPLATIDPDSVVLIDPSTNAAVAQVSVGGKPGGLAVGMGAVWVGNAEQQTLVRIDPDTLDVTRTIGLGVRPSRIAAGGGAVWVASYDAKKLLRIDPTFNVVTHRIDVSRTTFALGEEGLPGPEDLAIGGGAVWIAHGHDVVSRLSLETLTVVRQLRVGSGGGIALGDGAVWTLSSVGIGGIIRGVGVERLELGALSRIDPRTNSVTQPIELPPVGRAFPPTGLAFGEGAVWVIKPDGSLFQFDPALGRLTSLVRLGQRAQTGPTMQEFSPLDVSVGENAVWVVSTNGTVARVDPETSRVVATLPLGRYPRLAYPEEIAAGDAAVWVTMHY
jgi:YVTN family beta-propeller protein